MRYDEPESNEWVTPIRRGYKMACCDCGLVHDMDFRVASRRIQFRVRRNERSTARVRVGMGLRKKPDGGYRWNKKRRGDNK